MLLTYLLTFPTTTAIVRQKKNMGAQNFNFPPFFQNRLSSFSLFIRMMMRLLLDVSIYSVMHHGYRFVKLYLFLWLSSLILPPNYGIFTGSHSLAAHS